MGLHPCWIGCAVCSHRSSHKNHVPELRFRQLGRVQFTALDRGEVGPARRLESRSARRSNAEERLAEEARRFKEAADKEPPGSIARELRLRWARQAETASRINDWLSSPGLTPK
jgi:hypothetical protein